MKAPPIASSRKKDGPARRVLDSQSSADGDDTSPGLHPLRPGAPVTPAAQPARRPDPRAPTVAASRPVVVRAAGQPVPRNRSPRSFRRRFCSLPDGLDQPLIEALERCQRMHDALTKDLAELEAAILRGPASMWSDDCRPSRVGPWVALTIYAWVGDVSRFPNAPRLTAYAGLVPSVWQSGDSLRQGGITNRDPRAPQHARAGGTRVAQALPQSEAAALRAPRASARQAQEPQDRRGGGRTPHPEARLLPCFATARRTIRLSTRRLNWMPPSRQHASDAPSLGPRRPSPGTSRGTRPPPLGWQHALPSLNPRRLAGPCSVGQLCAVAPRAFEHVWQDGDPWRVPLNVNHAVVPAHRPAGGRRPTLKP